MEVESTGHANGSMWGKGWCPGFWLEQVGEFTELQKIRNEGFVVRVWIQAWKSRVKIYDWLNLRCLSNIQGEKTNSKYQSGFQRRSVLELDDTPPSLVPRGPRCPWAWPLP